MRTFGKDPNAKRPAASTRAAWSGSLGASETQKADQISRLQRTIGNRALQHLVLNKAGPLSAVEGALRSAGQPLDSATRLFMEARIHEDFSGVRVHTDDKAAQSADEVGDLEI